MHRVLKLLQSPDTEDFLVKFTYSTALLKTKLIEIDSPLRVIHQALGGVTFSAAAAALQLN